MSEKQNPKGEKLVKTAVALVTATGIALGGAFGGEGGEASHSTESTSIVELFNPDTDETDEGLVEEEKQRKSGKRSVIRVLLVGVPLGMLCHWAVTALCALLPNSLPLFLLTACKWVLTATAVLMALALTMKAAAPHEPVITTIHRSYRKILLLSLLFCCGEGALLWFFPAQAGTGGQWLRLLATTALLLYLSMKALKKDKTHLNKQREKSDRERVMELANSVAKKK